MFPIKSAEFVAAAVDPDGLPASAFPEVAFAGRSNVGKSSLINRLTNRHKLARTSSTPGCTRTINLFRVVGVQDGTTIDFVDLPGYGFARRSKRERAKWGTSIERFLHERSMLRAVIVILDARRGPEQDDLDFIAFLEVVGRTPIVVATKLDKLRASERKPALKALHARCDCDVIGFSAETGEGVDELWTAVRRASIEMGSET